MLGAIIGDIVGAPYEFNNVYRRSDVKPFKQTLIRNVRFTDDTILTLAVAKALVENSDLDDDALRDKVALSMQDYVNKYPAKKLIGDCYGASFKKWVKTDVGTDRVATTNGAAMRATAIGWLYNDIEKTMQVAEITARPSHNSTEAIKATQAVAVAVYLARTGANKETIKKYIEQEFSYWLSDDIEDKTLVKDIVYEIRNRNKKYRRDYRLKPSRFIDCDATKTVETAIYAFLISKDFGDCIKTAISLGGDSDTIACISGGIAEAYYGIPANWQRAALKVLEEKGCLADDIKFIKEFVNRYARKRG